MCNTGLHTKRDRRGRHRESKVVMKGEEFLPSDDRALCEQSVSLRSFRVCVIEK